MAVHYRKRLYRCVFVLAGVYNIAFAAWTFFEPAAFFHLFQLAVPNYPLIWRCLGMVIGCYGLLYWYAAARPDHARPFIFIGLLGKLLGPVGWVMAIQSGEWPVRTFPVILYNDVVWWVPFTLFLWEGTRFWHWLRPKVPYLTALLNIAAGIALAGVLRPGTEVVPDGFDRAAYIVRHIVEWRIGWAIWMGAGLSLVGFFAWWGAHLKNRWAIAATIIAMGGLVADLLAEALFATWLPDDIERVGRLATILSGAVGNTLYTLAGMVLTATSRALLGRLLWWWAWAIWASGLALTVATVANNVTGLIVTNACLLTLLCPWLVLLGRRLSPIHRAS